MAFAEPGFGRAFSNAYNARTARREVAQRDSQFRETMALQRAQLGVQQQQLEANRQAAADEIAARQQQERAKQFRETRDKLMQSSIDTFNKVTDAAAEAVKSGDIKDEEIEQFRSAANNALISTITTLQHDHALALSGGADPNDPALEEIRRLQQMLASQAPIFDARVTAARQSETNPTILGQNKGREQAAQVRALATELGIDEDRVAEGLGFVPGQPAPTELEKTERSLRLLDQEGVPDDDPRRLRVLGRLTTLTTPSIADVITPMIQKMARGEELTPEEQKALDAAQRLSFTEQLLRGLIGGGAGGGAPQYQLDESGNLVAK